MSEKLNENMAVEDFDSGYWYAVEIKAFAKKIGISPISKFRKDELEESIRHFLKTGEIKKPKRKTKPKSKQKDTEIGLTTSLPVVNYADIRETKDFIMGKALKLVPELKRKSGAQYRLNRWREEQINQSIKITYLDLVNKFIELNQTKGKFPQAPSGRYINFLSDFLSNEIGSSRNDGIAAWHELKELNIPKNYQAWKAYKSKVSKSSR